MTIAELISSLGRCDQNLEVIVEIKRARVLSDGEFRALSTKERKRVTLRQGKPVAFEPLALPAPGPVAPIHQQAAQPSLNERLAHAFVPAPGI